MRSVPSPIRPEVLAPTRLSTPFETRAEVAVQRAQEIVSALAALPDKQGVRIPYPYSEHLTDFRYREEDARSYPPLPRSIVKSMSSLHASIKPERAALRSGELKGEAFLGYVQALLSAEGVSKSSGLADLVIDLLLEVRQPRQRDAIVHGAHHFAPTPLRLLPTIVRLAETKPSDVLCDPGCGNGRLLALLHVATGCRARGIELIPSLAQQGASLLRRNSLSEVKIEQGDAIVANYQDVDVVVMYAPFYGTPFKRVVENFEGRAAQGPFRIVAHGPMELLLDQSALFSHSEPASIVRRFDALSDGVE